MPISRYQLRNVYSLADPELYKAADKNDPEALLEGVAMAGLVGVIRQLGDLAEFAAEIFHELHEEVTATAARGHGLLVRAKQLELEIPSIERSCLSQKSHSGFFSNSGIEWHPNQKTTNNLITTGDLPRFVMDSYEDCRGPPRLYLLDKFDDGGVGACLKRYTDPSFYKVEVSSYEIENAEIQRDKKIRKNKKKGSPWKGGGTPEISPNSKAKLHQLFLEDRMQNATTEPTHHVKLKKRPTKSPFDSKTGESYFNKLLNSQLEGKIVHQVPFNPSVIPIPFDSPNQSGREKFMDAMGSPFNLGTPITSPSVSSSGRRNPADNLAGKVTDLTTSNSSEVVEKKIAVGEEIKICGVQNGYRSDDVASEMYNYVDALSTMESEVETRGESRGQIDPSINQGIYSDQISDSQFSEIPFRPEKIPGEILEEGSENLKNEEHQIDILSPGGSVLSFQFFGNNEGEVENEHPNDGSSPMIHLPNILEIDEDNHSTTSVHSRCSWQHSGISRVDDEQPFGVSLAENDSVVEETLDSCEICCLPEEQLKEIGNGDDVLHISDSPEVKVPYFSQNGTELSNSETGIVTHAVSDADKSGDLKERETGLLNSEIEVGSTPVDDADRNDDNALTTHEDDIELKGKGEEISVDSEEMEKTAAVLLPLEESDDDTSRKPSLDTIPDTCVAASHDDDDDDDSTSVLQDSFLEENNQIGQQAADLGNLDLEFKSMNNGDDVDMASGTHVDNQTDPYTVDPASESVVHGKDMTVSVPDKPPTLELLQTNGHDFDQVIHQSHSDPCSVNLASQNEEDPHGKPVTVSVSESEKLPQPTSHGIDLFDQVKHQFHSDPCSINPAIQSEEDPQGKSMTVSVKPPQATNHDIDLFDQVKPQFHSDPHPVQLSSQSEEDPQVKPTTVSMPEKPPTNLFDQIKQQFHSDSYLVNHASQIPLPETPPSLKSPQPITHDIDQVKPQLPPMFPVFSIPPVKLQVTPTPPLPPLPPMQWRMRKLQNPLSTPTHAGQHNFPPLFQSKPHEIENEKFQHDKSEAKFAEKLVSQQISNAYMVPEGDEIMLRAMKIQRPRNPLIDALANHDKTKLRKVSDRAMTQITKGQENEKLLEQIRTKSYNLKPLVQTRSNIHGPTTNVRIAAILEKANAIRQAFAGSDDDDDDSDSWSDS